MSADVSVAAENIGGEFFQPIGKTNGKATNFSWPGREGKTTPRRGMSVGARFIR